MKKDFIESMEKELKEMQLLIQFAKDNYFSEKIIFTLTSILIQKRDRFYYFTKKKF